MLVHQGDCLLPLVKSIGDIYYDPQVNRFSQLRERHKERLVFGGLCTHYNDARTTVSIRHMSVRYLDGLEKVEDITKFEKAKLNERGHWCVINP